MAILADNKQRAIDAARAAVSLAVSASIFLPVVHFLFYLRHLV